MRVEEKIRSIVERMKDSPGYIYEDWSTANVKLDKVLDFPVVVNVLPVSGKFHLSGTQMRDYPNCFIAFLDKTEFDFDGSENEDIVERCKDMAREFILLANRSRLFSPISGDIEYSVVYDKLDVNLTGIVLALRMEELQGLCVNPLIDVARIVYGDSGMNE